MADIPPYVLTGQQISSTTYGNPMIDVAIDHESRLDALNAANLPARMTTAEGEIDALQATTAVAGAWRNMAIGFGSVSLQLLTYGFATWGPSGIGYNNAGTWTISTSGVYTVHADVKVASPGGSTAIHVYVNGASWQRGFDTVDLTMPMSAGWTVQIYASTTSGATYAAGSQFWIYRVGPV